MEDETIIILGIINNLIDNKNRVERIISHENIEPSIGRHKDLSNKEKQDFLIDMVEDLDLQRKNLFRNIIRNMKRI